MARLKRITAWFICMALVLSFIPEGEVQAATKVSKCKITLASTTYTYTKKAVKPKVTVKYKSKKLKARKNYTLTYKNNKKVGTATVVIKGKGVYSGTVKKKFQIVPKLSATKVSVDVGGTYTLKATSSAKVTYKSSDASVATVSAKGVVTGVKDGVATITVTSNKVKNTCEVTVGKGNADPGSATDSSNTTDPGNTDNPAGKNYKLSETDKTINVGDNTASISILNEDGSVYSGSNAAAVSSNETLIHARYIGSGVIELYAHGEGAADVTVTVEGRTLVCHITAVATGGNGGSDENGNVMCEMGSGYAYEGYAVSVSWNDGSNTSHGLPASFDHSKITWTADDKDMVIIKPYTTEAKASGNTIDGGDIYVDVVKAGETYIRASYEGVEQAYKLTAYSVTDGKYISVNENNNNSYDTGASEKAQNEPLAKAYGTSASSVLENIDFGRTLSETGYDMFNHTSGMAYYKKNDKVYFALCDVWNSRVLIYKGNSVKDATSKAPCAVLGQKNFTSAVQGYGLDQMNYPMDCAVDPDKGTLVVTDSHNDRLLIFDDIAAIADAGSKGVEANHAYNWFAKDHIGNDTHIVNPWGVNIESVNGVTKMIVGNLGKNSILIWNELPDSWNEFSDEGKTLYTENYYPDLVLSVEQGATPRSITWTGKQLIVGDENINTGTGIYSCFRVFNDFPTVAGMEAKITAGKAITKATNEYKIGSDDSKQIQYIYSQDIAGNMDDFIYADTYGEGAMINGRLYLVCHGGLYIYNDGKIDGADDVGDLRMWNTYADVALGSNNQQTGYYVCGGGMGQLFYEKDADVLWYGAFNDNQLVGWSGPEALFDNAVKEERLTVTDVRACPKPDIKVGADSYNLISKTDSSKVSFTHNPVPESDGEHLVVLDDLDGQLRVYKNIPYSSAALPDYAYEFSHELGDVEMYKDDNGKVTMIVTERTMRLIHIWNDYKFDGAQPDVTIGKRIGSQYLTGEVTNVEYDGTYFYLTCGTYSSEKGRMKVLVYKGIPGKESEPVAVISGNDFNQTYYGQVASNGNYVIVNPNGEKILVYKTSQLESGSGTSPLALSEENATATIDSINYGYAIATDGSNDPDTSRYDSSFAGSNIQQHFNLYDYIYKDSENNNITKKMYERTTISSMYDMVITKDNMLVITNMGDNRIVVWDNIEKAIKKEEAFAIIGHSEKSYYTDDLYGVYDYHTNVGTAYDNTLYMPNKLCFDGKNLWVGEYKWSNRLLRYRFVK